MGTTRRAETISANFRMQRLAIKTGYSQTKRSKDTKPTNKQITHTRTHTHRHKANNGKRKQRADSIRKAKVKFLLHSFQTDFYRFQLRKKKMLNKLKTLKDG